MRPKEESMEQRMSLVTLGVHDLGRARGFYEALGWRSGAAPDDDVVFFQCVGMIVALWDRAKLAEDSTVTDSGGCGGVSPTPCKGPRDGVVTVMEEARKAGGTIGRVPAESFWGGYSGIFIDPDGHPWEVAHNPNWTIEDDGSVTLPKD